MRDPIPSAPVPEPHKSKRSAAPLDKRLLDELDLAEQLVATAQAVGHASTLAGEEIDTPFLAGVTAKIAEADKLIGDIAGNTADKENATLAELAAQQFLIAQISKVQKRARRKYAAGSPGRKKYFIGQNIDSGRVMLEDSAGAIVQSLGTDTLPGHKPADTAALAGALKDYKASKNALTGGQRDMKAAHDLLEAKVKDIAGLRRQIQYAADTLWPHNIPAYADIRKQFGLPPDRVMPGKIAGKAS